MEFFINTPDSLVRQSATFSDYKSHNTVKCLIGIAPHGHVTFALPVFEGSASDRQIVEESGLLELLERGDSIMADKGFKINELLVPIGVHLNIPPFLDKRQQLLPKDIMATKSIAAVRIHVERAIGRLKHFQILDGTIDNSLFDLLDCIVFGAAMLCNFLPSLAA